ncbi:MAG: hypothetical protein HQM10_25335 [Candidatus Riflebacteria bacterium]|nr:hypothetical protein [Candidatus Riflebacteria bacterium]
MNLKKVVQIFLFVSMVMFAREAFCDPINYHKLLPGMPFSYFDLRDLHGQHWVSTYLRGRPIILLTAHRDMRYEVLKWADALKREFSDAGLAHVLWVVNLRRFPWNTGRKTIHNQWLTFSPPVPVLLDWHGNIGKSLRIDYSLPNIIAIDADGRFAFHQTFPYSPTAHAGISSQIRMLVPPGYTPQAAAAAGISGSPIPPVLPLMAPGSKGFSY